MKKETICAMIIGAVVAGVILSRAESPRKFTYLQITVPASQWKDASTRALITDMYKWMTGSSETNQLWLGWMDWYREIKDTNKVVYVYRNSLENIKGDLKETMTPDQCAEAIAKAKLAANVNCGISRTPAADLEKWGIEPIPSEAP